MTRWRTLRVWWVFPAALIAGHGCEALPSPHDLLAATMITGSLMAAVATGKAHE